ncbi:cytochrome c biogenesis heme-transporting ATPase CcmA [Undibacterium amnicola]|uniref:Cytochrome c biogenesis heme-transporting ATPase CcmA n=1 Tax=Undibacterium amnicola TaxID=1834038 RepID=A0ABR6XUL9_9BURK|nr:cytochrome c biogenesis heme-transporting ATPase CcmA [Undibacterium amnicola]MBC3832719.1 cytochrome c biogenesis heme-transporting ATPase CcmA [Undibacterium amnicola]
MALTVHNLTYSRGERQLFSDISFDLQAGESLWVTGSNGAGKTSLLRLLCGLSSARADGILWKGRLINEDRYFFHSELLYIGHQYGIKADLNAFENLHHISQLNARHDTQAQIINALLAIGLSAQVNLPARVLSQGQQKRVALARLFLPDLPTLLILDEPFSALDNASITLLLTRLAQHVDQGGIVVYTSHQEFNFHQYASVASKRLHLGS